MRVVVFVIVAFLASGCERTPPLTAGGKPVEHWLQAIQGPDVQLRKKAAIKLGNIGTADPAVVPALLAALQDADAGVRAEAIRALARLGPAGREAIPALTALRRNDPNARVREDAGHALAVLTPSPNSDGNE